MVSGKARDRHFGTGLTGAESANNRTAMKVANRSDPHVAAVGPVVGALGPGLGLARLDPGPAELIANDLADTFFRERLVDSVVLFLGERVRLETLPGVVCRGVEARPACGLVVGDWFVSLIAHVATAVSCSV
jgi:hypothetical protein